MILIKFEIEVRPGKKEELLQHASVTPYLLLNDREQNKKEKNMTKKRCILLGTAILVALLVVSGTSIAAESPADAPKAKSQSDMAAANKAMSNPITDSTLFMMENDTTSMNGSITTKDRYLNATVIEPVIPISIGDSGWNLINRPIVPLVTSELPELNMSKGALEWDRKSGLGDIVFFSLVKPPSTGHFQWAIGPTLTMDTASDDALGSGKWSAGPAAVALYASPSITLGALIQQWWSFSGDSDRQNVSEMNIQYFISKQFNEQWSFTTAPIIVADWKADGGNKWSVPIGAGVAYSFITGKIPSRASFETQVYVVQPDDFGPRWNIRLALTMVLPKL